MWEKSHLKGLSGCAVWLRNRHINDVKLMQATYPMIAAVFTEEKGKDLKLRP